jgi:hypothetical protein
MRFDGVTGYAYQAQPAAAVRDFTVETWFATSSRRGGRIVGFGNMVMRLSETYDRHVYLRDDGRLTFGVYTGVVSTLTSPRAYNDDRWHHLVASQGPGGMALYVDGGLVARNRTKAVLPGYVGYWRVGGDSLKRWPHRPSSDFFAGGVDETAVYPVQLAAQRVVAHYRASGRVIADERVSPASR